MSLKARLSLKARWNTVQRAFKLSPFTPLTVFKPNLLPIVFECCVVTGWSLLKCTTQILYNNNKHLKLKKRTNKFYDFPEMHNLLKDILPRVQKKKKKKKALCACIEGPPMATGHGQPLSLWLLQVLLAQWAAVRVCVCAGGSPPAVGRHINLPGAGVQVEPWPGQAYLLLQNNTATV